MAQPITLLSFTANPQVDAVLRGAIGVFLSAFSGRIRAAYLVGSYADGSAVALSDIDLRVVFMDDFLGLDEEQQFLIVRQYCRDLSPIPLDCPPLSERRLMHDPGWSHEALSLKCAGLHLYGADLRDQLSVPDLDVYTRNIQGAALHFFAKVHRIETVSFPLEYPDPHGEFYGYVDEGSSDPDFASTKMLVHIVGFAAASLLARQAGRIVVKKSDWLPAYQEAIHDEWTSFLERLYRRCKMEWGYRVPVTPGDRLLLRELCAQTLAFENHYLVGVQGY